MGVGWYVNHKINNSNFESENRLNWAFGYNTSFHILWFMKVTILNWLFHRSNSIKKFKTQFSKKSVFHSTGVRCDYNSLYKKKYRQNIVHPFVLISDNTENNNYFYVFIRCNLFYRTLVTNSLMGFSCTLKRRDQF